MPTNPREGAPTQISGNTFKDRRASSLFNGDQTTYVGGAKPKNSLTPPLLNQKTLEDEDSYVLGLQFYLVEH